MCDGVNTSPDYDCGGSDICWDISVHRRQGQALSTSSAAGYNTTLLLLLSSPPPSGSAYASSSLFRCRMHTGRKRGVGTAIPPPLPLIRSSPSSPPDALVGVLTEILKTCYGSLLTIGVFPVTNIAIQGGGGVVRTLSTPQVYYLYVCLVFDLLVGGGSYWPKWPNWPNLHQWPCWPNRPQWLC